MGEDPSSGAESTNGEDPPTDEEQVETEWHIWLLAVVLFGGGALFVSGQLSGPDLVVALVAVVVFAWLFKTGIERAMA